MTKVLVSCDWLYMILNIYSHVLLISFRGKTFWWGKISVSVPLKANAKRHREPQHTAKRMTLNLSKPHDLNSDCTKTYGILQIYEVLHNLFEHIYIFSCTTVCSICPDGLKGTISTRGVIWMAWQWCVARTMLDDLERQTERSWALNLRPCLGHVSSASHFSQFYYRPLSSILIYRLRITLKIKKKVARISLRVAWETAQ